VTVARHGDAQPPIVGIHRLVDLTRRLRTFVKQINQADRERRQWVGLWGLVLRGICLFLETSYALNTKFMTLPGLTPLSENGMMEFYAAHAYGESTHHEMLMQWMLRHRLIADRKTINSVITTVETNACVNFAYQLAVDQNRNKWFSGIE